MTFVILFGNRQYIIKYYNTFCWSVMKAHLLLSSMSASNKLINQVHESLVSASTIATARGKYYSFGSLATTTINCPPPPHLVFKMASIQSN